MKCSDARADCAARVPHPSIPPGPPWIGIGVLGPASRRCEQRKAKPAPPPVTLNHAIALVSDADWATHKAARQEAKRGRRAAERAQHWAPISVYDEGSSYGLRMIEQEREYLREAGLEVDV